MNKEEEIRLWLKKMESWFINTDKQQFSIEDFKELEDILNKGEENE